MQRDLLDALRCPHPHDEQWLVALVHAADGPRITAADLACPLCQAVFAVRHGIGAFRLAPSTVAAPGAAGVQAAPEAMRLAALLGGGDPGGTHGTMPILLAGHEAAAGVALAAIGARPQLWINPVTDAVRPTPEDLWAVLEVDDRLPLGRGTLAAASLDAAHAGHPPLVASVALAIRPGGRLVAPAGTPVPPDVKILADDPRQWVGEVVAAPGGLVTLRRQSPPA